MTRNKLLLLLGLIGVIVIGGLYAKRKFYDPFQSHQETKSLDKQLDKSNQIVNGDIIFQTSQSSQSKAIQLATHSKYSHCGMIFWEAGDCYVWEASDGVVMTSIDEFIERGEGKHFVIKRLKNPEKVFSSHEVIEKMSALFYDSYYGKPYDSYFGWADDKIYCSELVWKLYKEATGVEIGKLQRLSEFDLEADMVKQKLKEQYGASIPLEETVISPANIFNSDLLTTVKSN